MVRVSSALYVLLVLPASGLAATLREVLTGRPELSAFNAIAVRFPALLANVTRAGGTVLAPTNEALSSYFSSVGVTDISSITEAAARDVVSYHTLPLSLRSADLSRQGGALADTTLLDADLSNLQGAPNVVFASAFGSTGQERAPSGLKIYSGVGAASNVTTADLAFDDGYLHVIDRVLNFPKTCTETAESASLSTLLDALQTANLTEVVDTTPKFTCFAPTDAAFQAAGIDVKALTVDQLTDALKYHSIVGDVGYSTAFEDGKEYQTLLGVPVTVRKRDGQLFINDVAVQRGNVIMTNGVAHVLSGVLSPPASPAAPSSGSAQTTSTAPGTSGTPGNANSWAMPLAERSIVGVLAGIAVAVASGFLFV